MGDHCIEVDAGPGDQASSHMHAFLCNVLLASFGHVFCAHAGILVRHNKCSEAAAALSRVVQIVEAALPCSERLAALARDRLNQQIKAMHELDLGQLNHEIWAALLASHSCYGGGVPVWRIFNGNLFAQAVFCAADELWGASTRSLPSSEVDVNMAN